MKEAITMQRIISILTALLFIAALIPHSSVMAADEPNPYTEKILGYYECTSSDNEILSDMFLAVFRKADLVADPSLLEAYIDFANQRQGDAAEPILVEEIADSVSYRRYSAYDPYICFLHIPGLVNGLWLINAIYAEDTGYYRFVGGYLYYGSYFGYIALRDMAFQDGIFTGRVCTGVFDDTVLGNVTLTKKAGPVPANQGGLEVSADHTGLSIEAGDTITLMAAVKDKQQNFLDPSSITFQLTDGSVLRIVDNGIWENQFFLKLQGELEGTTFVNFSDSGTGEAVSVPITVTENRQLAFTLSNVPQLQVGELVTNFYNFSGLYIDNYRYDILDDQAARVSFDVYNTNYIYGMVEVYNEAGKLENAVLINKKTDNNTSIKQVYWDGPMCVVRDCITGNSGNYRKEAGFSICTPVQVDIPKNGYIKITIDPMESNLLGIVNSADFTMSVLSLMGQLSNFSTAEEQFTKDLTATLVKDAAFAQLREDGSRVFLNMDKELAKGLTITPTTIGDFTDTLSKQLTDLNVMETISKSLADSGVDYAEGVLKKLMGVFGIALDGVFTIGKAENVACAYVDYTDAFHKGSIRLQNQGGGFRSASQVQLERGGDFDPEVAAQVYAVALDQDLLELVKQADRETYELLTAGLMHTYNISLVKNGDNVQHSAPVTVHIPIPNDLQSLALTGNVSVYRVEENGALTDMHAVVDGGTIRFETDHFSLYVITEDIGCRRQPQGITIAIVLLAAAVLSVGIVMAVRIARKRRS